MNQLRFLDAGDKISQSSATSPRNAQPGFLALGAESDLRSALTIIDLLPSPAADIARCMLVTGARVHEILNLEVADVADTGHLLVRAGKGSDNRVCYCPEILPFKAQAVSLGQTRVFHHYSYSKLRRAFKRAAKSADLHTAPIALVTNLLRRAAAELSDSFPGSEHNLAQRFLGHRSPSSTLYYLNPRKARQNG